MKFPASFLVNTISLLVKRSLLLWLHIKILKVKWFSFSFQYIEWYTATWRYKMSQLVLKNISLFHCSHLWNICQCSKRDFISLLGHVISSMKLFQRETNTLHWIKSNFSLFQFQSPVICFTGNWMSEAWRQERLSGMVLTWIHLSSWTI